jgi:hypothetical protein
MGILLSGCVREAVSVAESDPRGRLSTRPRKKRIAGTAVKHLLLSPAREYYPVMPVTNAGVTA